LSSITQLRSLLLNPENIFRFFKYAIYALLAYDALLFFEGDLAASAQMFGDTVTWRNVIEAYSATFDTVAWVLLLLLFELETAIIPDHLLKGRLKWVLKGLAGVCYFFIIYSFYGYIYKYGVVTSLVPFEIDNICSLIGTNFTYVLTLDEYVPLDQAACAAMNGLPAFQIAGTEIIGVEPAMGDAIALAVIDVVNAATWLIVVLLLEVEVYLQLKDKLTGRMLFAAKYIKGFFYLILLYCAIYWGVKSSFLDFWDAFLWLVAFVFIELNIFQWNSETEEEKEHVLKV
jgi:hypothetical protein